MGLLDNRMALVTGAGRGIGRSIAIAFAREGAKVAITARTESELEEVANRIAEAGSSSLSIVADLSHRAAPLAILKRIHDDLGTLDILVNNAGIGSSASPSPLVDYDDEFWDRSLAVNLTAPYLLTKLALPEMLAKKKGRVITIASIAGKVGLIHGSAYAASKHGVIGLMKSVAIEVAGQGVTVNSICPGPVKTQMCDRRVEYDADRLGMTVDALEHVITPIGRRLVPDEVAPLAVYLASDAASVVTAQSFNICGGMLSS